MSATDQPTDWDALADRLARAAGGLGARYADIRLEKSEATQVVFHGRRLDAASRTFDAGGLARALGEAGGWGVCSFNGFDAIEDRLAEARDAAAVQAGPPTPLAPTPAARDRVVQSADEDFRDIPLADKVALMRSVNQRLLDCDERIVDTRVIYADRWLDKLLATSEGGLVAQSQPFCQAVVMAVARDGDNIQRAAESVGDTHSGYRLARSAGELAEQVAARAVELLSAPKVKAGRYPVVLDPKLAGVFIHEAFGHLSEADHVCENAEARRMMVLGRPFAPEFFNVYDDASLPGLWGSHRYDDEGSATGPVALIRDGRLAGRLHSRYTAAAMGERPTASAYAVGYGHAPIVRMSNTYIAAGSASFDALIAPIKLGVYACGMYGGQTMLENFSFSAAHARMIRDGRLAEPVRDVVLSGNLFVTLKNISGLGGDLRMFGGGGCGKGGQSPLPVALGSPHLRIDDCLIGGQ